AKGYRFSLDAILLAHFVRLRPRANALELGTGSGVISLILADRWKDATITGIDIQAEMVAMAKRSVAINGLEEKIQIREGDARNIRTLFPAPSFDAVVSNSPYRKVASGRINPLREKALARHEITGTGDDFLKAAGHVLKTGGRAFFIYPATRAAGLICSMKDAKLEPKRLRIVHSNASGPGKFVLLEGIREGGEELEITPPLFIYDETGGYTEEMDGIFRELASP
ncbi:MAG: tRNA1(Val) (adenine(37)-N6)-methyltransferase, partial [Syntrophales bacterium LBB04]|nr:tRNA1(Val) (adenine(37)-N6)-methyltransferase [Syntrophales bacterium LBB04]